MKRSVDIRKHFLNNNNDDNIFIGLNILGMLLFEAVQSFLIDKILEERDLFFKDKEMKWEENTVFSEIM